MRKIILIFFAIILAPVLKSAALDVTSMRIKGLGNDMQGIVADDYTDLLANPARERFWRKKQLIGRIGSYGNPIGAGYSAGKTPLFLLVEGSAYQSSQLSANNYSYGSYSAYEYFNKSRSDNYGYSAVALSGFGSDSFGVGLGFYYDASYNKYKYASSNREANIASLSGPVLYRHSAESATETTTSMKAPQAVLGFHWRNNGKAQVDSDLLLKFSMFENKVDATSFRASDSDFDPDGDGISQGYYPYGSVISTPSISSSLDSCAAKQRRRYYYGGGVEYRKKKTSDDERTGYLLSFSWQSPNTQKYESRAHTDVYSVSGTTTTNSSTDTYRQDAGKNYSYAGAAGVGWMWKMNEKLWMGLGLRGEVTYAKRTYQSAASQYYPIYTQTLVSEKTFLSKIGLPLSAELQLAASLSFRGSITCKWDYTSMEKTIDSGSFPRKNITGINSRTYAEYGVGMGYRWRDLDIDMLANGDLAYIYGYQLQIGYKFM